jgi:hypothetical protein
MAETEFAADRRDADDPVCVCQGYHTPFRVVAPFDAALSDRRQVNAQTTLPRPAASYQPGLTDL